MVDVARLNIVIDATSAKAAEQHLTALEKATTRLDTSAHKLVNANKASASAMGGYEQVVARATRAQDAFSKAKAGALTTDRQEEQLLRRNADLRAHMALEEALASAKAELALEKQRKSVDRLRMAYDPLGASIDRVTADMREFEAALEKGALSQTRFDAAMAGARAQLADLDTVHRKAGGGARFQAHELSNLGAQFADIGVSLASGQKPWMVAIQQGSQISAVYGQAAARGATFSTMVNQLGDMAGKTAGRFGPLILATGAFYGAFAIGAQQANESNRNLIDSLGLTDDQLKKVKNQSITAGDVMKATFLEAGEALWDAFGPQLTAVGKAFKDFYDDLISNTVKELKAIVGGFLGAYEVITSTWRMLPAAMGDIAISAANFTLKAIEALINRAGGMINSLIDRANDAAGRLGVQGRLGHVGQVGFGEIENRFAGGAGRFGDQTLDSWRRGSQAGAQAVDHMFDAIGRRSAEVASARWRKEAGEDNSRRTRTPRDMTDERSAQFAGLLARAEQEELQARLALTDDVRKRAELQKQILAAEMAEQMAQIDRQRANITDDKGLSSEKKKELLGQLDIVRQTQLRAGELQKLAVDDQLSRDLLREANEAAYSRLDAERQILEAQADAARTVAQRRVVEEQIRQKALELSRLKAKEVLDAAETAKQRENAQRDIDAIEDAERVRLLAKARDDATFAFDNTASAMNDIAEGFKSRNWERVANGLAEAIATFQNSLGSTASKLAGAAGLAQGVGAMIGGSGGAALAGAGSGAMGGMSLVASLAAAGTVIPGIGNVAGAAIGAVIGGLGSLFGSNKAKKQRRAQEAAQEAQRLAQIAQQAVEQQITLMRLRGEIEAADALAREQALKGMDASLHARQREIWAVEDQIAAEEKLAAEREAAAQKAAEIAAREQDLRLQILDAAGKADEALVIRRRMEREEAVKLSPALGDLVDQLHKAQDAAKAAELAEQARQQALQVANDNVASATSALTASYEHHKGAIEGVRDRFLSMADAMRTFARDVQDERLGAVGSPFVRFAYAQAEFRNLASRGVSTPEEAAALQQAAERYRQASKYESTSLDHLRNLAEIEDAAVKAQKFAEAQVSAADQQLEILRDQVAPWLPTINTSVLSISAAIGSLASAVASQRGAENASKGAGLVKNNTFEGYTRDQLYSWKESPYELPGGMYNAWLSLQALKSAGIDVPGFASGGFHAGGLRMVGEQGPELEVTGPSRIYSAEQTRQMMRGGSDETAAEVRAMSDRLNARLVRLEKFAEDSDRREKVYEVYGQPVRGTEGPNSPVSTKEVA